MKQSAAATTRALLFGALVAAATTPRAVRASVDLSRLCAGGVTGHRPTPDCRGYIYCNAGVVAGGESAGGGVQACWPNQLYNARTGLCEIWQDVDTSECPEFDGSMMIMGVDGNANPQQFYCGVSAGDAAQVCEPCPGGQRSECTDPTHNCFANIVGCDDEGSQGVRVATTTNDSGGSQCGGTYADALNWNCRGGGVTCPSGDGCPIGLNCYDIPPGSCPEAPAAAASSSLAICGSSYTDAETNCDSNPECPSGDGCPTDMACFDIPKSVCHGADAGAAKPYVAPAPPVVAADGNLKVCGASYALALSFCRAGPSCNLGDGCPVGQNCFDIPPETCSDTMSAATATNLKVCGSSYNDAAADCLSNPKCPSGDGCPTDMGCFDVPADVCNAKEEAGAAAASTPAFTAEVVATPVQVVMEAQDGGNTPPPDFHFICGQDYSDAASKCGANKACPGGDGCATGTTCYALPPSTCPELAEPAPPVTPNPTTKPTPAPTPEPTPPPTPPPTPAPVTPAPTNAEPAAAANLMVCGADYNDAAGNCNTNPKCPDGDGCPTGAETCYALPAGSCPEPPATPAAIPDLMVCGANYGDATSNCRTNAQCPSGDGCPGGSTCYSMPAASCSEESVAAAAATPNPTARPTTPAVIASLPGPTPQPTSGPEMICGSTYGNAVSNCRTNTKCPSGDGCPEGAMCYALPKGTCPEIGSPTQRPTPFPTTPRPTTPTSMYVCGSSYNDASRNTCSNPRCPSGAGCPNDGECFALAYNDCSANPGDTAPMSDNADVVQVTASPTTKPTISKAPVTASPTKSPVLNRFFCGKDYTLAEENCWDAEPCPTGTGCSDPDESCFGISAERCHSKEPTLTPTTATPSTSPTPNPTRSPEVNSYFCGKTYSQAAASCGAATACPLLECPGGLTCYSGIECTRTADDGGSSPLADEMTNPYQYMPAEEASPSDGGNTPPDSSPGADAQSESAPASEQTVPSYVHYTSFCGSNYNDASRNCKNNAPCPYLTNEECPGGLKCYPVGRCEVVSSIAANVGDIALSVDTVPPTRAATPPPSWNWNYVIMVENGAAASCATMKSLALAGVVLAALIL
mmetsp:Transcript_25901/g.55108  ORF Transcript_25901/g.55108 Transcript_25901/m.55108 type:complete len:1088 (+) Transcript_25901:321-3584(+)